MYEKETIIDKLGRIITKIGTAIMMNLMFLVCCVPVVTIGQAWAALLSAVRFTIRGDSWWDGFKFGFKTRFLRGTVAWCILLAVDVLLLLNVWRYTSKDVALVYPIAACIIFAQMTMFTAAFSILNVYIPTDISNWIRNASVMVFKAPLQLLLNAGLLWAPVFLVWYRFDIFYYLVMIFIVAYFTLTALVSTVALKGTLMDFLVDARAQGTLIAEEGRVIKKEEEESE